MTKKAPSDKAEAVKELIGTLAKKLKAADTKPAVSDMVRLLQLQKELEPDEPREVIVRWVEPFETASANKE